MIREAKIEDLPEINAMMDLYGIGQVHPDLLKDIALVSERGGKITGFIWGMISESKFLVYVDYLTVLPDSKGDGFRLAKEMVKKCHSLGVKNAASCIFQSGSGFDLQAERINSKIGLHPNPGLYKFLLGDVGRMAEKWVR